MYALLLLNAPLAHHIASQAGIISITVSHLFHHKLILLSQGNSAHELGGALYSIQPSISIEDRAALNVANNVFTIGDLYLDTVNMTLNSASQGGCMYVTGNGANVTAVNSFFDRSASGPLWRTCLCLCPCRVLIESAGAGLLTAALPSCAQSVMREPACLPAHLSVCLPVCLSACLSVCLSACLSVGQRMRVMLSQHTRSKPCSTAAADCYCTVSGLLQLRRQ